MEVATLFEVVLEHESAEASYGHLFKSFQSSPIPADTWNACYTLLSGHSNVRKDTSRIQQTLVHLYIGSTNLTGWLPLLAASSHSCYYPLRYATSFTRCAYYCLINPSILSVNHSDTIIGIEKHRASCKCVVRHGMKRGSTITSSITFISTPSMECTASSETLILSTGKRFVESRLPMAGRICIGNSEKGIIGLPGAFSRAVIGCSFFVSGYLTTRWSLSCTTILLAGTAYST